MVQIDRRNTPGLALVFLAVLAVIQTGHMAEHVAQVIQKFVLLLPRAPGLLGSIFDFEWVHFVYNNTLEIGLIVVYLWWRRVSPDQPPWALTGVVWFQGYHSIEHFVKMYQYYALGITVGPKGILGFVFPLIWLHFFLNLITLTLMLWSLGSMWRATRRAGSGMVPLPAPARST